RTAPLAAPLPAPASVPVAVPVPQGPEVPDGEVREGYEEVPTVPWWDRPEGLDERRRGRPGGRLLLYAVALLAALLVTAVVGAVALG
ncbi:XRE family transcriptional regulator, partial [Streptomyces sp. SID625]|nr:XRE family transcriptional regulator [Streptomyces sp. SID625]